jgi:hypothetical protein
MVTLIAGIEGVLAERKALVLLVLIFLALALRGQGQQQATIDPAIAARRADAAMIWRRHAQSFNKWWILSPESKRDTARWELCSCRWALTRKRLWS